MPPKPQDVWDDDDDWTGLSSQQERRRRQNRIHQRAYRKKPHLKRLALSSESAHAHVADFEGDTAPTQSDSQTSSQAVALKDHQSLLRLLRRHDIHKDIVRFLQRAASDWDVGRLVVVDLPVLTRLNSFDALAKNAFILNIPVEVLSSDDDPSPFCLYGPQTPATQSKFPNNLSPTSLQRSVRHHPWLDLFPVPRLRDNILEGISTGLLDEDDLCEQLVCDLLNFKATSGASLMIWGDSWDIHGWEFSPDFFVKWAPLLRGCDEMLRTTNYWRAQRGESQLHFILN